MVVPPGSSFLARAWSTWIHCSSQVASAKRLMRSCVISTHSLTPISVPTEDLISLKSLKTRMFVTSSDPHFRDRVENDKLGFRDRQNLGDADAGGSFQQGRPAVDKADHRHVGHHETDRSCGGQRQGAFRNDLRFSLRRVLHGDDDTLGAAD